MSSNNIQKNGKTRDAKGRLLPGHPPLPGAGRPKRFDFTAVAKEWAAEEGIELRDAMRKLVGHLFDQAQTDFPAAKFLVERLCAAPEPDENGGVVGIPIIADPESVVPHLLEIAELHRVERN